MERRMDESLSEERPMKGHIDKAEAKGRKRQNLGDGVSYRRDTYIYSA